MESAGQVAFFFVIMTEITNVGWLSWTKEKADLKLPTVLFQIVFVCNSPKLIFCFALFIFFCIITQ